MCVKLESHLTCCLVRHMVLHDMVKEPEKGDGMTSERLCLHQLWDPINKLVMPVQQLFPFSVRIHPYQLVLHAKHVHSVHGAGRAPPESLSDHCLWAIALAVRFLSRHCHTQAYRWGWFLELGLYKQIST